ncbi:MAG: hypothetical protein ACT4OJ_12155, partial [Bacteroidota bacterium]
ILFEFFRFEDEFFLEKISQNGKGGNANDDIPEKVYGLWFLVYRYAGIHQKVRARAINHKQ